ncbi:hypothetical protein [Hoeflea sp.]|uniref:hypothetical protein n=1 Tax=Hoeflea sp. TaxID=1940281 RepID=UPI001996C69E|nr:hypothetical protein [Hoeflea sp.]MBC7285118.1 hypothetical protein [Hoeflea sp.]
MVVGLILVGTVLGGAASVTALLLGASIWTALLLYAAIGAGAVLALAVSLALRPGPQGHADRVGPYALTPPQRG